MHIERDRERKKLKKGLEIIIGLKWVFCLFLFSSFWIDLEFEREVSFCHST